MLQMFEIHVQKNYSDQHWYEIHYHLSTLHTNFIRWLVNGLKISDCHRLNMSPSEKKYHSPIKIIDVTVWTCHHLKKIFIFISIWICHHMVCHHMNNIHICHHFGMKFPDGDRYEFFIPSLHMVTFVTVWRLGMKIFHTCHQKSCSDGDGLIGFTIEAIRAIVAITAIMSITPVQLMWRL